MEEVKKEFFEMTKERLEKDSAIIKVEEAKGRLNYTDKYGNNGYYVWENELYEKVSYLDDKLYTFKVLRVDGGFSFYIQDRFKTVIYVLISKKGILKYQIIRRSLSSTIIKPLYLILKEYVENKKEYRIRLKTGVLTTQIEERLEEILSKYSDE